MHSSRNRQVRESTVSSAVAAKEKICVLLPDTERRKEEEEGADVSKKKLCQVFGFCADSLHALRN